ncbi:hypothetical protein [Dokdonella sp.]|uniref:hypothetical protein n=1 Tax=Dokdonella sp. TaxID=2291710 RepID=UPI0037834FEC
MSAAGVNGDVTFIATGNAEGGGLSGADGARARARRPFPRRGDRSRRLRVHGLVVAEHGVEQGSAWAHVVGTQVVLAVAGGRVT